MVTVDSKKINHLLANPKNVKISDIADLQYAIKKHPYFHGIKALELKALKDNKSLIYNQKLKETAAYTTDREVLFQFITNFNQSTNTLKNKTEVASNKATLTHPVKEKSDKEEIGTIDKKTIDYPSLSSDQSTANSNLHQQEITVEPNAPLEFSGNEKHSFSEWLKLTTVKPIIRTEEKTIKKKLIESPLIDKFLKNNPKIKPVKKSVASVNLASQNAVNSDSLMTETLAKVYIAQKNYKKAIQAYKILSLKNPEKSGLFADQIRAIKKLQDNNQ